MSVKCKLVGVPGKTYAFPKNDASPKIIIIVRNS